MAERLQGLEIVAALKGVATIVSEAGRAPA